MTVWAFAMVSDNGAREKVYQSVLAGKSRFGWSGEEDSDLRIKWDGRQAFLLSIQKGDWIVHVNSPQRGTCVAVQTTGTYDFDNGIECSWGTGRDFRHFIPVDINTFIEFDRNAVEVLPTVNLNPRQRYQRVLAVDDFQKSIDNLRNKNVCPKDGDSKGVYYLKEMTSGILPKITELLHKTHKAKQLERFFAKVFESMPNVFDVNQNGFGWGTDYGADLIVTTSILVSNIQFENKIVVQIKSYENDHYDLSAVNQIETALQRYNADAAIILTTANKTSELNDAVMKLSKRLNKQVDLIAGDDVAKFVLKYASELVFNLDY